MVGQMAVQGSKNPAAWRVAEEQAGERLETFVRRHLPHLSRRECARAIAEHAFKVNGRAAKKGDRLSQDDVVTLEGAGDWLSETPAPQSSAPLKIVYEDGDLLAVDKPSGTATHGFSGRHRDTLANILVAWRPELASVGGSRWQPGLVNRLDRETSGLVLVARNQPAFARLREQFRRRQVKKTYWALVWGETAAAGSIGFPIAHDRSHKGRMRVIKDRSAARLKSWRAHTRFCKLAGSAGVSFLEIGMTTGVTHQIRVHLAAIGHPIVGDALYGPVGPSPFQGQLLHAGRLEFRHPSSREPLRIDAPLPAELRNYLSSLGIDSAGC